MIKTPSEYASDCMLSIIWLSVVLRWKHGTLIIGRSEWMLVGGYIAEIWMESGAEV
jgi:hypothetical protein